VKRYKVSLVVKCYSQKHEINYDKVFASDVQTTKLVVDDDHVLKQLFGLGELVIVSYKLLLLVLSKCGPSH
jgi:hypothetical protein